MTAFKDPRILLAALFGALALGGGLILWARHGERIFSDIVLAALGGCLF